VEYGKIVHGYRILIVKNEFGDEKRYKVPLGKQILVNPEDRVEAGEALTSGNINPHDILKVKGLDDVREYLLDEIQEVYRIQGVEINDKHLEIIIRQMTRKVKIKEPGDSLFMPQEFIDHNAYMEENERLISEGKEPAQAEPILLGITKAALNTDSFLASASFQETNRILTEAALEGKYDNLEGLKENIIIGHLIPAGTCAKEYKYIDSMVVNGITDSLEIDVEDEE
jgi:DNA-directed RNA polymerase subunit beta'